ncbi:unnamed protein product, partial [Prorocentrum cordatum]
TRTQVPGSNVLRTAHVLVRLELQRNFATFRYCAMAVWTCPRCTLENSAVMETCAACKAARPVPADRPQHHQWQWWDRSSETWKDYPQFACAELEGAFREGVPRLERLELPPFGTYAVDLLRMCQISARGFERRLRRIEAAPPVAPHASAAQGSFGEQPAVPSDTAPTWRCSRCTLDNPGGLQQLCRACGSPAPPAREAAEQPADLLGGCESGDESTQPGSPACLASRAEDGPAWEGERAGQERCPKRLRTAHGPAAAPAAAEERRSAAQALPMGTGTSRGEEPQAIDSILTPGASAQVGGYTVKNTGGGVLTCTCPAWRFRKGVPVNERSCKHLQQHFGAAE